MKYVLLLVMSLALTACDEAKELKNKLFGSKEQPVKVEEVKVVEPAKVEEAKPVEAPAVVSVPQFPNTPVPVTEEKAK